jgi:hypothetical protein
MVIACAGYRVVGPGHHQISFQALEIAMGPCISALSAYFDVCRRQRNQVDYDLANVATEAESKLLVQKAELRQLVEEWIRVNHPGSAI